MQLIEFTLRRGRAVQIKCLQRCGNREYDKSAFRKSGDKGGRSCKSHVPEAAGCSVDSKRPRVSGTQLSCASVGD